MRTFIIFAGTVLLTACSTPQQRAQQMQADAERMMVTYGPACSRLGYADNSDPWRNCVIQLSTRDEMQRYSYPGYSGYYGGFGRGYWGPYW